MMRLGQVCGWAVLTAVVISFAGAGTLFAQKPPVRIKTEGKVVAVAPGIIQMHSAKDGALQIKIPDDRKVVAVTGKLHPTQLQPGMIVRFTGKLMGAAMADPVSTMTIYRPIEGYQMGVINDDPNAAVVTGTVVSCKAGKLIVSAGPRKITANLTEDAVANVETGDYTIAKAGDAITVSGYKGSTGIVTARELKIQLTIPEVKGKETPQPEKKSDPPAKSKQ